MSRTLKIFFNLLLITMLFFNFYFVQATEEFDDTRSGESLIDEDIDSDNIDSNKNVVNETSSKDSLSNLLPSSVTSVSNINDYASANLELNNTLSIILISIGVLLILFAIAILIRLKN